VELLEVELADGLRVGSGAATLEGLSGALRAGSSKGSRGWAATGWAIDPQQQPPKMLTSSAVIRLDGRGL
jgi:hypothetical protein